MARASRNVETECKRRGGGGKRRASEIDQKTHTCFNMAKFLYSSIFRLTPCRFQKWASKNDRSLFVSDRPRKPTVADRRRKPVERLVVLTLAHIRALLHGIKHWDVKRGKIL